MTVIVFSWNKKWEENNDADGEWTTPEPLFAPVHY